MTKKLDSFEKKLMLEEITFYSICSEQDRKKLLNQEPMTFDDFRRFCLITDYLELSHLHQFIWEFHNDEFADELDALYEKCEQRDEGIQDMILKTGAWLDDFWKQAPNETVAYLLHEVFAQGLSPKKKD